MRRRLNCFPNLNLDVAQVNRCITGPTKLLKPYSVIFKPTTTVTASSATNAAAAITTAAAATTTSAVIMTEESDNFIRCPTKNQEEADVGIFCYISQLPGFRGILKQRYSDFIVNEVDLEGNVVHLTSLDVPSELVEKQEATVPEQSDKDYAAEIESFRSLSGDADADRLKDFIEKIRTAAEDSTSHLVLSPSSDKSHRTAMHNFFKEKLKFLVTDTVDGPDVSSKCIRVRLDSGSKQNRGRSSRKRKDRGDKPFDSRGSDDWPANRGKFLRFNLYKENKDTQEALRLIGKMLGVQPRSFGFAGTKDKRSVSTQKVTIFKQRASRLASLNERLIGIKAGDFCYVNEGLVLGQLQGNRFTVTLRGVVADSEDTIKASADELGKCGFINYFGLQRFGSGTVPTHLIGAALLRGEWKAAVCLILDPREGERDTVRKIREYYKESNDIDGTLRKLPHNMVAERAILQCLKKCPGNYLQALKAIPRTLRMMYVHSYQSYLWNHAASTRVQKFGAEGVVLGDLVYCKEDSSKDAMGVNNLAYEDDIATEAFDDSNLDELPEPDVAEERRHPVKVIDAEDLFNGNHSIEDVVLPLPGSRAIYPGNDIADIYHDLARKDNISLTESVHNVKEFSIISMTGGYRRVFQKPSDYEWEMLTYTDGDRPLAETDLDVIAKSKPVTVIREDTTNNNEVNHSLVASMPDSSEGEGNFPGSAEADGVRESSNGQISQLALKLCFTLPTSSYATMAIRELLKTSTSVAFHKTLNNQT